MGNCSQNLQQLWVGPRQIHNQKGDSRQQVDQLSWPYHRPVILMSLGALEPKSVSDGWMLSNTPAGDPQISPAKPAHAAAHRPNTLLTYYSNQKAPQLPITQDQKCSSRDLCSQRCPNTLPGG